MTMADTLRRIRPPSVVVFTFLAAIAMLGGIGYWCDGRFGTFPACTTAGVILGIFIGIRESKRVVRDWSARQ